MEGAVGTVVVAVVSNVEVLGDRIGGRSERFGLLHGGEHRVPVPGRTVGTGELGPGVDLKGRRSDAVINSIVVSIQRGEFPCLRRAISQVKTVDGGRTTENTASRPVEDSVTEMGLGDGLVCSEERKSGEFGARQWLWE